MLCGRASNYKMCVFPAVKGVTAGERVMGGKDANVLKAGDYVDVIVRDCTAATLICDLA